MVIGTQIIFITFFGELLVSRGVDFCILFVVLFLILGVIDWQEAFLLNSTFWFTQSIALRSTNIQRGWHIDKLLATDLKASRPWVCVLMSGWVGWWFLRIWQKMLNYSQGPSNLEVVSLLTAADQFIEEKQKKSLGILN